MSTRILTTGGFDKIHSLPSQDQRSPKVSLYFLKDLTPEKIARAKAALEQKLQRNEQHHYTYEGKLQNFEEDIKEKPYLLKEGNTLQLLEGKEENTTEKGVVHQIRVSQKASYLFQSTVTVGGSFNIGNNAHVVIHLGPFKETYKPLNISPLETLKKIYRQDPFIERFSGKALPLEESYINLQIVQEEEQKQKEEKLRQGHDRADKEEKNLSHSPHLITFEEIYTAKKPIEIKDLFALQPNETQQGPLRRLVLGKAGIGKSTFCKYAAYIWSKGELWNELFDWVFWIPLRELDHKKEIDLMDFIYQKWFKSTIEKSAFDQFWRATISPSQKVLFLLDGYDELSSDASLPPFLNSYTSSHVLITSRPHGTEDLRGCQRLEITGFTDENIEQFINHCFKSTSPTTTTTTNSSTMWATTTTTSSFSTAMTTSTSSGTTGADLTESLLQFLHQNPVIYGIARIPIQLDLLCSYWQDQKSENSISPKIEAVSMTSLYHKLEISLLKRHFKPELGRKKVSDAAIESKGRPLIHFLSQLAFLSAEQESLIISSQIIDQAEKSAGNNFPNNDGFLDSALQMGLLKQIESREEYYFLHLTFQEYYAARYLVSLLKNPTTKVQAYQFIREEKYNRRMQIVFWFAAGLCGLEKDGTGASPVSSQPTSLVDSFFQAILDPPQDFLGIYEAQLSVRLLEEAGLPETKKTHQLRSRNDCWIIPQPDNEKQPFDLLAPFLVLSPHYTKNYYIPKYLQLLQKGNNEDKIRVCLGLSLLAIGDEKVVKELLLLIETPGTDRDVQKAAWEALENLKVPESQVQEVMSTLLKFIRTPGTDRYVRGTACEVLRRLKVPESQAQGVVSTLLKFIQTPGTDPYAQEAAWEALENLKVPESQAQEVVSTLLKFIQTPGTEPDAQEAAWEALENLKVPESQLQEVVNTYLKLIQPPGTDPYAQEAAWEPLENLKVPEPQIQEVVSTLLKFIETPGTEPDAQEAAWEALENLKEPESQAQEVVNIYLKLIQTPGTDPYAQEAAWEALENLKVPEPQVQEVVSTILKFIQPPGTEPDVQRAACWALGNLKVPESQAQEVVNTYLKFIQTPGTEPGVQMAACRALKNLKVSESQVQEVVNTYLKLIETPGTDPYAQGAAWEALGNLKVPESQVQEVVNTYLKFIQTPGTDPWVQKAACGVLENLKVSESQVQEVVNTYLKLIETPGTHSGVQEAACWALENLKVSESQVQEVINLLLQLLQTPGTASSVQKAACGALESLKMPELWIQEIVGSLLKLIQTPSTASDVQAAACRVLKNLKMSDLQAQEVVSALLRLIQVPHIDSDWWWSFTKNYIFSILLQEKNLDSMNPSQFRSLVSCDTPEAFTSQWIESSLNLSRFLTDCFKRQFFEKECIEVIIGLALEGQSTLYLDQGKLHLHQRTGKESFPKEGTCSEVCLQFIGRLKEEWELMQQEKPTLNEALTTTTTTTSMTAITTTTSTTVTTLTTTLNAAQRQITSLLSSSFPSNKGDY